MADSTEDKKTEVICAWLRKRVKNCTLQRQEYRLSILAVKYSCRNRGYQKSMPINIGIDTLSGNAIPDSGMARDDGAGTFYMLMKIGVIVTCHSMLVISLRENRRWQFGKHSRIVRTNTRVFTGNFRICDAVQKCTRQSWRFSLENYVIYFSYRLEFRKFIRLFMCATVCLMCRAAYTSTNDIGIEVITR